ncbi:MAG: flippase-like domain-containing protein [Chloroflexi bacterium]|nr:flippase-like domain-containing protein [Chloroflexota bacterium]
MKRWLNLALQIVSFLLFGLILWQAGPDSWRQLLEGDRRFLWAAFFVHGSASMVAAIRLRLIATALRGPAAIPWRRYYRLTMTARALGLVLPRSLSAIGGKAVGLRAWGASLKRSVWIVMVDNLFDVTLLAAITPPALLFVQGTISPALFGVLTLAAVALLAVILWQGMRPDRAAKLFAWLRRFPRLAGRLNFQDSQLLPPPRQALAALGWSVLLNGIIATSFFLIGRTVRTPVSWPLLVASYPIVQLSLIIAIAPGGLGIFDLGWLGMLRLGGITEADALTFVIAQRAFVYVFVLIWAAFSSLLSLTVPAQEALPPDKESGE